MMKQGQVSFTLIELLLVVALMLFLSVLAIPALFDLDSYVLNNELEKLAVVLGYQQQRALVTNQIQTLTLDGVAQTYTYFVNNNKLVVYKISDRLRFGFIKTALGPPGDPKVPIDQAITFTPHPTKTNNFIIVLFPNGNISAGSLYIVDKNERIMGALTCSVSRVSYIRRYLYQSNQWVLVAS
jgi:type II secretory pathway pseudopilin PulG